MINASNLKLHSSLDAGSKKRLEEYCSNLKREYDHRNFDHAACNLFQKYLKPGWVADFKKTKLYLRNLKSSSDGHYFSQGVKDYEKLRESAEVFTLPNHPWFGWNKNYKEAKRILIEEFSRLNLSPVHYHTDDDVKDALPKMDTHAGFTYILTGKKEKGDNIFEGFAKILRKEIELAIRCGSFRKPILVAVRTQGSGHAFTEDGSFTNDCDHKTRMVSMVDLIVILAELTFAKPLQAALGDRAWYAGGKNMDTDLGVIITSRRAEYNFWITLDYSQYDASISAWLIHDGFEILRAAFPNLSKEDEELFKVLEHDFIEKDFIMGDEILHSTRGVPSGSMFTSIMDSIVNRLMILTYCLSKGIKSDMIIMGDDNNIWTYDCIDRDDIASYLTKNFGIKVNPHKIKEGRKTDDPEFLSVYWTSVGRYREPHEVIAKLLYPERKRIYGKGRGTPQQTIYSYFLAYPVTIYKMLDVSRFLGDFPELRHLKLSEVDSRYLPGFIKYIVHYTGAKVA